MNYLKYTNRTWVNKHYKESYETNRFGDARQN